MGLWMRQDGDAPSLAFASMQPPPSEARRLDEYSITLPVHPGAKRHLRRPDRRTGTVWADDLRLFVDGKPVWERPRRYGQKLRWISIASSHCLRHRHHKLTPAQTRKPGDAG